MNARTHYISLLRTTDIRQKDKSPLEQSMRKGLMEWILYRDYWGSDDGLEKLASDLDVTKDDLSSYLFVRTGKRLRTIKKELRMHDAKKMLLMFPEIPICRISDYVGIGDKSNFRRLFKDDVGFTPAVWRKGKGNFGLCRIISLRENQ